MNALPHIAEAWRLHEAGALSLDEFTEMKRGLLASPPPVAQVYTSTLLAPTPCHQSPWAQGALLQGTGPPGRDGIASARRVLFGVRSICGLAAHARGTAAGRSA